MESHADRHKKLHRALDELAADMIEQTGSLPSRTSVLDLMKWSHQQTVLPTGQWESEHKRKFRLLGVIEGAKRTMDAGIGTILLVLLALAFPMVLGWAITEIIRITKEIWGT